MTTDQLGHIIKDTLVSHRFVVLPNVGAFLLRKMPARIHPIHDRIEPPKDEIRFNEAIKDNDGLLIAKLSKAQGLSYDAAESMIKSIVAEIQFELTNRSEVSIGPLGTLSTTFEGRLIFTEAKSLESWPSQFGLASIKLRPKKVERKVNIKQLAPSAKKLAVDFPVKKAVAYAAAFALLVSLGIIPMTNENNRNMASLSFASFLGKPKEVRYTARAFQPMEMSASYIAESEPKMEAIHAANDAADLKVEKVESELEAVKESNTYYVVAGSFPVKSGADDLIADLSARGFGGIYIGEYDGAHLVSYGSYASLNEAKGMKASVKLGNPDAWVLAGR